MTNIKDLVRIGFQSITLSPLVPILLIAGLIFSGCQDSITDVGNNTDASSLANLDAVGKREGKGKPASSELPITRSINVTEGIHADADAWLAGPTLKYPSGEIHEGATPESPIAEAEDFFGCPDAGLPCYKIVVEIEPDTGQTTDKIFIMLIPFITSEVCLRQDCPWDESYGDSRRLFSLFDTYLGTPYMLLSDLNGSTATFYWQGQRRTSLYNGSSRDYYWLNAVRNEFDSPAFYRFQANFSNGHTYHNSSLAEIDTCVSSSSPQSSTCVFDIAANLVETTEVLSLDFAGIERSGKGRKATSVILIDQKIRGNSSPYDVWGVYAVHNTTFGGTTISKYADSTNNPEIKVSAEEGCLSVRPVSGQHLAMQTYTDLITTFNSFLHPAWIFDVVKDGTLSKSAAGSECTRLDI